MKHMFKGLFLCLVLVLSGCQSTQATPVRTMELPVFSGAPYEEIDNNNPDFTENELTTTAYKQFSALDSLGRAGTARAVLGPELLPDAGREDISEVRPSGWVQADYAWIDGGKLYNRSHLLAFSLTGENANPQNLITGTRYLNATGMEPFESMILDYIRETGNHVLYQVEPVYEGDDLVAKGVIMEAYSIEDDGQGISFHVYCFNVQPGVEIDYATGQSQAAPPAETDEQAEQFVLNTRSLKFHRIDCPDAQTISGQNREYMETTVSQMIEWGYSPHKECVLDVS